MRECKIHGAKKKFGSLKPLPECRISFQRKRQIKVEQEKETETEMRKKVHRLIRHEEREAADLNQTLACIFYQRVPD